MQLFVPDPYVGAHQAVAQLHAAHATLETLDVIEQLQALDDHGSAAAELRRAVRTLLLTAHAQHRLLRRANDVIVPVGCTQDTYDIVIDRLVRTTGPWFPFVRILRPKININITLERV